MHFVHSGKRIPTMLLWVHNPITSRKKIEEPYSHPVASKGERVKTTSSHPRTVTRRWASLPPAPLAHRVAETLPKVTDEPQSSTRGARVHPRLKLHSFERGGMRLRALLSRAVLTPSGGSEYCSCAAGCSSSVEAPGDPSPPSGCRLRQQSGSVCGASHRKDPGVSAASTAGSIVLALIHPCAARADSQLGILKKTSLCDPSSQPLTLPEQV